MSKKWNGNLLRRLCRVHKEVTSIIKTAAYLYLYHRYGIDECIDFTWSTNGKDIFCCGKAWSRTHREVIFYDCDLPVSWFSTASLGGFNYLTVVEKAYKDAEMDGNMKKEQQEEMDKATYERLKERFDN